MAIVKNTSLILGLLLCFYACKKKSWDTAVTQLTLPYVGEGMYNTVLVDSFDRVFILGGDRFERNDFLQSNDNGATWQVFHYNAELYSNKVLYAGTIRHNMVYAVGYDGKIFRNPDFRYDQWLLRQGDYFWYSYTGIAFGSDQNGCAVGHAGYDRGVIQRIDAEAHSLQVDSFPFAINDICFVDAATAYAAGYGALVKTVDSGKTWQQLSLTNDNYRAIYGIDKDNIWTVGYNGTIAHITQNGTHFNKVKNGQNPLGNTDRYRDIAFKGADGYIVGEKGVVMYTSNAGKSWSKMKKFTSEDLHGVAFHPTRNTVYFVGNHHVAFKTTVGN
ncbi:YCF48-related protein [Taibaiella sp. KBW10]|uniref:WD40/YVTN/BNR-like repeat-containing protein n=1 Tax=Taibaiella sp. KBW10 TaxID=2153357 RepID=UPI0013153CE1|nr:YCF48-related protein [Taibaiella sp. KBW10]